MGTSDCYRANVNLDRELPMAESFARLAPQREALRPEELTQLNLDVASGTATALGALPKIQAACKAAPQTKLLDLSCVDMLEDSAFALMYAHAQLHSTTVSDDDLAELNIEAVQRRTRLCSDVRNLCVAGILPEACLDQYTGTTGYTRVASDLGLLTVVLTRHWENVRGKCCTSVEDLDRAERISHRMIRLVGLRDDEPAVLAAAADTRARAFTLFIRNYDECRRIVSYLRWHEGDADSIAPTLYANAGGRKKFKAVPVAEAEQAPAAPFIRDNQHE